MDIDTSAHRKLQKMNKIRNLMDKGTGGEKGSRCSTTKNGRWYQLTFSKKR